MKLRSEASIYHNETCSEDKDKSFLLFLLHFKPRKKRFSGRKMVSLAIPQSEASSTGMSQIDEYISSSPTYQQVPDFQRVQITGDYASGVSCSWTLAAGKTLSFTVSALPFLPFLLREVLAHLPWVTYHCISKAICRDLYFCLASLFL